MEVTDSVNISPLIIKSKDTDVVISYEEDGVKKETSVNITVVEIGIDNSKINQTQLDYGCGAGKASINLFTQRLLFEHQDLSVGVNNYQIEVSHLYNSYFDEVVSLGNEEEHLNTNMGKGFKLNVQQYLFEKEGKYLYVDSMGYRHSFVELGDGVRYYDTDGLGLLLQVENGEKVVGDGSGNKMYFDAEGRLIKTISCYSEYLVKYFSYNDRGQLITIYDGRTPNNVISLSYDASTGLLKTMCSKQGGNIKRSIEYFYEKYNDIYYLVKITDESGDDVFAYNESGELVYAASKLDKTALTFRYKNYGITEVTEGIQDEDISKNTGLSASENIYISKEYIKDINSFSMKSDKSGVLVQNLKGLTKNNDKDVNVMYYFNKGGYTTAVLESPNGEENELRALEKLPGAPIVFPQSNLGEDKINKQSAYKVWDKLETNSLSEEVIDYRQKKYIQYKYYNVCFWLKLSDMLDSGKIIVNVQTSEGTDTGSVYVDNTAINAWQYVTVPVRIGGDTIKKISINSGDANMSNSLIADPRLSYSTKSGYFISSESGSRENIDSAEKISYKLVGADKETSISLNTECYMSGKDLHETILSIYNERPKKEKFTAKSNFILSLCNGTRKLWVENVEVHTKNNIFPLGIKYISPESGENSYGVACFEQETISPDDSSSNCGQMYLYPFVSLGGYAGEAIRQVTVCKKKNGDKTVETESCIYADFKGRTLQETDEYGVTITYYYDNFGSVQKKIVSHSDTTEKFVCDMEETSSSVCEKTEKSCVKAEFDETAGNIVRSSYSGKDEEGDTIAEYIYDEKNRIKEIQTSFRNLENPIENEVYGKNTLNYDERGRLYRISDSETHIEIGYNAFNEPNSYSLGKREMQKISNREEGSVSTILYNLNESYKTKIYTDKYGRTDKIENYKNSSMERSIYFARQELNESDGAAEVTEMFDGYEQKTYKYTYDEFNNPTGYRREKNNNDFFELKKIGPTKIEYTNLNSRIYQLVTEVKYDEEVNLFPRVSRTMCTFTEHYNTQQFWYYADYTYDSLGRIKEVLNSVEHHPQDSIYLKVENSYVNGTGLKEQIRMVSKNTYGETDDEYVLTYGYDKRGRIKTQKLDKSGADSYREEREYVYDGLDRVRYEKIGNETREYSYGPGGRVQAEYVGDKVKIYHYNFVTGCLEKITEDGEEREFNYDRLGNCTYYSGENYNSEVEWERGFLLKSINGAKYSYNTQGQRFRKELDGKTINYTYDGGKLIAEDDFAYFYDGEGIAGFAKSSTLNAVKFLYVKDGTGNVIAILNELGGTEVARYSYDAYGKCKVMNPDGTENKNENFIGNINPIRWKSQYYDKESGLYYIDGRYYSPEIRQYLSAESLEETVEKGLVTDGLGSYQITVANPVNMMYNEYTIEPNTELSYDPEPLSEWKYFWNVAWPRFWRSSTGKALAIGLFAFATAATAVASIFVPGVWVLYGKAMASGAAFFLAGAAVSGLLSAIGGGDFLEGAWNYIRTNWSQALAIESLMYTVALGISCIAAGRRVSANKQPANAVNQSADNVQFNLANRGKSATGRRKPYNLKEKLAMEQTMSEPLAGKRLPVNMTDSRWMGTEGWIKMQRTFNFYDGSSTTIHYVLNQEMHLIDDFKFVFPL